MPVNLRAGIYNTDEISPICCKFALLGFVGTQLSAGFNEHTEMQAESTMQACNTFECYAVVPCSIFLSKASASGM